MKKIFLSVIPIVLLSACGSSTSPTQSSTKQTITSSSSLPTTNNSTAKVLSGILTVGDDGDLSSGTYDLKAVSDGYGAVSARTSDDKSIFRQYMASPTGLEKYNKQHKDGNPDLYIEDIPGVVLHNGDTIKTNGVSIEFTKVD
ncbi:hypothetical protein [Candidatus Enterococcus ikei]|uniref:Lipoprotein n=1 Tax=Candidatus Enterococcus ikei TaxID=2815326 RepID=A0ABS3H286_9ENTE|nr:hypothetical protein [Enterococcus sp. DIV0869a]MBO0441647.1 hypothetical protein [Enterococcus sp. DIV0869a]